MVSLVRYPLDFVEFHQKVGGFKRPLPNPAYNLLFLSHSTLTRLIPIIHDPQTKYLFQHSHHQSTKSIVLLDVAQSKTCSLLAKNPMLTRLKSTFNDALIIQLYPYRPFCVILQVCNETRTRRSFAIANWP